MGHFRKFLCGFPNCLCFLSHCSPPTFGSIGHAIVGIQYFKGLGVTKHVYTVTVYQSPPWFCRVWVPLLCVHWFVAFMLFIGHLCTLWPISCSSLNSVQVACIIWRNCQYSEDVFQIRQYADICRGRCHQQPNDMPGSAWPNTPGKLSHQKSMWCRGCPDVAGIVRKV